MKRQINIFIFLMLGVQANSWSQGIQDTAAVIKTYNKIMSFTTQQYLHYITSTKLTSSPALQLQDTATIAGELFKNDTEIYSNNGNEEMYMQDSLLVQVNNSKKTIWLSKVDVSSKDKMNTVPVGSKEMQSMVTRDFIISQAPASNNIGKITFESRKPKDGAKTVIIMEYNAVTNLPKTVQINVSVQQPVDEDMIASLKEQQVDDKKVIREIDGVKYLVRTQQMLVSYTAIDSDKEKLAQMPLYSSYIKYNSATKEFTGIGKYGDYEITKMF